MVGNRGDRLRVSDLTHKYRRSKAFALDVDVSFHSGRTIILGPNGAGKTTLFGLCANRLRVQRGSIALHIADRILPSSSKDFRVRVGFMPQQPTFIKGLSAIEHLAYAAWLAGLDGTAARQATSTWIERVNLSSHAGTLCSELSGGMQRRLAFAASSVNSPAVLLLDEPTAGLDPRERAAFRDVVTSFDADSIVLISTHQIDDLDLVADRIAVLASGQFVFHGGVKEFLDLGDSDGSHMSRAESAYERTISREPSA